MPGKFSPDAERVLALKVGKSCVVASRGGILSTARKHAPASTFASYAFDGRFVITRTA